MPWLLDRGFVTPDDVIRGRLTLIERSGRNLNVEVRVGRGGLFVKQPDPAEPGADLAPERAFYALPVARAPALGAPRLIAGGSEPLVLERVNGAPLGRALRGLRGHFSALGAALRVLHATPPPPGAEARAHWSLSLARPGPEVFEAGGPAGLRVVEVLQAGALDALDALRDGWRPVALLHGDLRPGNVLAHGARVHLLDWECWQAGDPAWDLGCALAILAERWLDALPPRGSVADAVASTPLPMRRLRPAARGLRACYGGDDALWERATRLAGARLAASVVERFGEGEVLPTRALLMLQLATNLLQTDRGPAFFGLRT